MASSHEPVFVRGVWGPYYGAMFPSFNLNEGGQSAAGAFLDFVIASHPAGAAAIAAADAAGEPVAARLNRRRGVGGCNCWRRGGGGGGGGFVPTPPVSPLSLTARLLSACAGDSTSSRLHGVCLFRPSLRTCT